MNGRGNRIPAAWLLIVPIVSIWWMWKYAVGVEEVTRYALNRHGAFWLMFLLGSIGDAIVQNPFNSAIPGNRLLQGVQSLQAMVGAWNGFPAPAGSAILPGTGHVGLGPDVPEGHPGHEHGGHPAECKATVPPKLAGGPGFTASRAPLGICSTYTTWSCWSLAYPRLLCWVRTRVVMVLPSTVSKRTFSLLPPCLPPLIF